MLGKQWAHGFDSIQIINCYMQTVWVGPYKHNVKAIIFKCAGGFLN